MITIETNQPTHPLTTGMHGLDPHTKRFGKLIYTVDGANRAQTISQLLASGR